MTSSNAARHSARASFRLSASRRTSSAPMNCRCNSANELTDRAMVLFTHARTPEPVARERVSQLYAHEALSAGPDRPGHRRAQSRRPFGAAQYRPDAAASAILAFEREWPPVVSPRLHSMSRRFLPGTRSENPAQWAR